MGILWIYKKHPLSMKRQKALKTQHFQGFLAFYTIIHPPAKPQ
jgi:hypothetical protein